MAIREVHAALQTLLLTVSITDPATASIERVYKFPPPSRQVLTELPCAMLTYEQQQVLFKPALLMRPYSIHVQVFVEKVTAEADVTADIASALLEEIIQALSGDQTLGGSVSVIRAFRGASPETLTVLEWAGVAYVGLDLYVEVTVTSAIEHAA